MTANKRKIKAWAKTLTLISLVIATPIHALTPSQINMFSQNNIIFYNPNQDDEFCGTVYSDCNIIGETDDEKLWSGIRHVGFTPVQTAAIMSNIRHEGSTPVRQEIAYNIARERGCLTQEGKPYSIWEDGITENGNLHHASCMQAIYADYAAGTLVAGVGIGLMGWTWNPIRLGYLEEIKKLNLLKYFDGDAYKEWGTIAVDADLKKKIEEKTGSDTEYWALWCTALHYVHAEMERNGFKNMTGDSEVLAGWVSANYEKCPGCQPGQTSYNSRVAMGGVLYARYEAGEFNAVELGTAPPASSSPGSSPDTNNAKITLIGDSVSVRSIDKIRAKLPNIDVGASVNDSNSYIQASKSFTDGDASNPGGLAILDTLVQANKLNDVVVYALGTNNVNSLTTDIVNQVVGKIGTSKSVIFITNYGDPNKYDYTSNNNALKNVANAQSNVFIADWEAKSSADINKYIDLAEATPVHPTIPDGTELFAQTLYNTVANAVLSNQRDVACSSEYSKISEDFRWYSQGWGHINAEGDSATEWQDYRWLGPNDSTLEIGGCGPSAMAMILTALTHERITPGDVGRMSTELHEKYDTHLHVSGGSSHLLPSKIVEHMNRNGYNLSHKVIDKNEEAASQALREGWLIWICGNDGNGSNATGTPFTPGGHCISIISVTESGKWIVGDSNGSKGKSYFYDRVEFNPSDIINHLNTSGFHAIRNN